MHRLQALQQPYTGQLLLVSLRMRQDMKTVHECYKCYGKVTCYMLGTS